MESLSRRAFVAGAVAAAAATVGRPGDSQAQVPRPPAPPPPPIDRKALVGRHNVTLTAVDPLSPLQVGNGEFAFSCDVTGLQTLAEHYRKKTPLNTMAQWAWHAFPNPDKYATEKSGRDYQTFDGRTVPYFEGAVGAKATPANTYLRGNPHRLSLVRLALVGPGGTPITPEQLSNVSQTLDLWTGVIRSSFRYRGQSVRVQTAAHPTRDIVAVRVDSPLLAAGELAVRIGFPGPSAGWRTADDWSHPETYPHADLTPAGGSFERKLDDTRYFEQFALGGDTVHVTRHSPAAFDVSAGGQRLDVLAEFAPNAFEAALPADADAVAATSAAYWPTFWKSGAAVDFSACTDPRAPELERRVVLSQYLTKINCSGTLPPQETGLVYNSWYGKHHLEMHWWHAAHFAMWGRSELLERSLGYYDHILPRARATAQAQGYDGVRWPKMTDPDGRDSPSEIGLMLIWQQPHPIYYAEQIYRARPTRATLDRFAKVVEQTARFMASYAAFDKANNRYVLGPPLIPAQESYHATRRTNTNPTYELAYWQWGLTVANAWRERLGKPRDAKWDDVAARISRPAVVDGKYVAQEAKPQLLVDDHPSFLQAFGFLPQSKLVDETIMRNTLKWARQAWPWDHCWGWDFPVLAQTAARLNEPEMAVDALLIKAAKNRYLPNGHNSQTDELTLYLPGNGGLLAAVAMMCGGWDGGPTTPAPGFPKNGKWDVRCEGFERVI